jgi:hypothetical protein
MLLDTSSDLTLPRVWYTSTRGLLAKMSLSLLASSCLCTLPSMIVNNYEHMKQTNAEGTFQPQKVWVVNAH